MYKGKVSVWAWVIVVVLVIQFFISVVIPWVGSWGDYTETTVYAESMYDEGILNNLGNTSFAGYEWYVDKQNPDIFITDDISIEKKEGYTKYPNSLYSPLVLYVRSQVIDSSHHSGFIRMIPEDGNNSPLQIDLYNILEGIEQDKDWKDIGVSTKVVKGKINVCIPNERCPYYSKVVDLFYLTLNNNKVPTEDEKVALTSRVNALLNKCEKITDISSGIAEEYQKHSEGYKVFIAPEYLLVRGGNEINRSNYESYTCVYFMNTTFIELDTYVKSNYGEGEPIVSEDVFNLMKSNLDFYRVCGWRVRDSFLNMSRVSYSLIDKVPGYK